jgi:hypothetical protein
MAHADINTALVKISGVSSRCSVSHFKNPLKKKSFISGVRRRYATGVGAQVY